jgi:hypothetical protein
MPKYDKNVNNSWQGRGIMNLNSCKREMLAVGDKNPKNVAKQKKNAEKRSKATAKPTSLSSK